MSSDSTTPKPKESLSQAQLNEMLVAHERFVLGKQGGRRLNLSMRKGENLSFANRNLAGAELPGAVLTGSSFVRTKLNTANLFGADIRNCDMRFADLTSADLRGAILRGANFENAVLKGTDLRQGHVFSKEKGEDQIVELRSDTIANFENTKFARASFEGAKIGKGFGNGSDLSYASFKNTRLNEADLMSANLRGANFDGADLSGTNLSGANLKGANLLGAKMNGTKFEGADMRTTRIDVKNLVGIDLSTAQLPRSMDKLKVPIEQIIHEHAEWIESLGKSGKQAVFEYINLAKYEMVKIDLSAASFINCIVTDSDFSGSKLTMSKFEEVTLDGSKFVNCDLRGTSFTYASMVKADFSLAAASPVIIMAGTRKIEKPVSFRMGNLPNARFFRSDLTKADLSGCILRDANFENANLVGANLEDADVTGASFKGANLEGARMDNSVGFNPDGAKAKP